MNSCRTEFLEQIKMDTVHDNVHEDIPETFENREEIIASIPSYEDPHIKVPKVLTKPKSDSP
ncbi:hypothetical protein SLEP1_g15801 [Rubroshorea leprosula]|uniref:Uncharacterized protein n=1 Tax=Rubroshorea leprosula TaxID=152421 RepID=A0AAV5INM5_9ROSI|nr:hypothetical protein SLEP1_g15801 [Rubroshorea leprosula]